MGDGSTEKEVSARVKQIRNLAAASEQEYEKEKLNERIARLSGGVAIIQVGGAVGRHWLGGWGSVKALARPLWTLVGVVAGVAGQWLGAQPLTVLADVGAHHRHCICTCMCGFAGCTA